MSQCDEDSKVETDDTDDKCLTLEDISTTGVAKATDPVMLKDFLLLRKEFLPVLRDDADNGEENASLEANYGDESSCCVSDVSSLSFQNAVLDDPEYNSCSSALMSGERSFAGSDRGGNDLQDVGELSENVSEVPEYLDEIAEMPEDALEDVEENEDVVLDEDGDKTQQVISSTVKGQDVVQVQRSTDEVEDCDGEATRSLSCDPVEPVAAKSCSEESRFRNADCVLSKKNQHQKSSPGLARRMLLEERPTDSNARSKNLAETSSSSEVVDTKHSEDSEAGDPKNSRAEQLRESIENNTSHVGTDRKCSDNTSKDFEELGNDRGQRSIDRSKRDRIAHMDAVYQKQIEALMLTKSGDCRDDFPSELPTMNADVKTEFNHIKCTWVQDNRAYFGMEVARNADDPDRGASIEPNSVSDTDKVPKSTSDALQKVVEPAFTELSLDAAGCDPDEPSVADGKTVSCHMPSVEDGLSSGHASDCDETATSKRDPSPAETLRSQQKIDAQRRPDSFPSLDPSTDDHVVDARQRNVELAIQDIRSAIEKSKRVKLISPSGATEEQPKSIDDRGQEPIWITRKEMAKDLQKQTPKNSNEVPASPPDLTDGQKSSKSHAVPKGAPSVTRKHNKKYIALPLVDNDVEHDFESESLADSQNDARKTPSHADDGAVSMTASGNVAAADGRAGRESDDPNQSDRSGRQAEGNSSQFGRREDSEGGISSSQGHQGQVDEPSESKRRVSSGRGRKSEEYSTVKSQSRAAEGEYSTDEETDELLNKQYTHGEKVDIPELSTSPLSRSQNERRQNRAREVALRDPSNETVLIEGVLFRANYLGSTQLISEGQPSKGMRMMQAQEAVGRIKAPDGETQPSTEVDLFVSVEKIMVLNTDLQEIMMDHALRTISYIADIGDILVVMARRGPVMSSASDSSARNRSQTKICCHVFESDEAQLVAQSIGQAFQVSYMEFLKANGIDNPSHFRELDYQEVLNQQEIFGEELYLFSNREMQKEIIVPKVKGEPLGVVIVESGWGSMVPTVVLANMSPNGAAARCGQLNIGDQIMSINGISLVGLPLSTCQNYIKVARHQSVVKVVVVSCPPVVEVLIKRPDIKYQLGFSVQNGVICSLLRGGIAERGGIRVGHRIIEINGQSVVAISHERIVQVLATSVGEIQMKTMPTSIFRLLTGQDTPHYI